MAVEIPVYSVAGQVVDHFHVEEAPLGGRPNMELVREALLTYEANRRVGTASTRNRAQTAGSGKKPWRQKHTGRARQGSRTSPLWVGGGVSHGPRPRDYRKKMNRAARRAALCSAFLAKALDGEVLAVDRLELPELKTRHMAAVLRNLGVDRTFLVVLPDYDPELWRCTRNIPGARMVAYRDLNAYEVIRPRRVIFTVEALGAFVDSMATRAESAEQVGVKEDG